MLVKEIMSRDLIWCTPADTAQAAAKLMKDRGVGALPVVSDGVVKKTGRHRNRPRFVLHGRRKREACRSHSGGRGHDKQPSHMHA